MPLARRSLISFGNSPSAAYQACYYSGVDSLASQIAKYVTDNGFDGVDIDFEDTSGFDGTGGYDGVDFLTQLTDDLYSRLPQFQNIITHAPETPYLLQKYSYDNYQYPPYDQLYWNTANEIAWFNVQTYNNCPPTDCTAQNKIDNYISIVQSWGIPSIKLVVGVPVDYCGTTDPNDPNTCTGNGYIQAGNGNGNDMYNVISQLESTYPNQFGGVMGWDFILDSQDGEALEWTNVVLNIGHRI